MSEKGNEERHILTRKDLRPNIHVSYVDHRGVKWWANQRKITIAAALHEMIVAFLGPKLIEVQEEAIFQAVREGKLPQKAADGTFKRLLNIRKGLGKGRRPPRRRRRLPPEK